MAKTTTSKAAYRESSFIRRLPQPVNLPFVKYTVNTSRHSSITSMVTK